MIQRKRFRIEDIIGGTQLPQSGDADDLPTHRQIMAELRAIRDQMAKFHRHDIAAGNDTARPAADAELLLQTYRAQIEQCEKLKIELDLIYNAINRTKQEIAVLHGKSFNGAEMAKVTGELGAVVGGTEEATQQILEAVEAIDQAASALASAASPDQQRRLTEEIQEQVVAIFEACNFQDLTGQRISKVMNTMNSSSITSSHDVSGASMPSRLMLPVIDERWRCPSQRPKLDGDTITPRRRH